MLRVDPFTGVPVDDSGSWIEGANHTYLCFSSEKEARDHAAKRLASDPTAEWSLLARTGEQIAVLHDKDALAERTRLKSKKRLWRRLFGKR